MEMGTYAIDGLLFQQNHPLVFAFQVQHHPRPFIQHVPIEAIGVQQRHAMLQGHALFMQHLGLSPLQINSHANIAQSDDTPVTVNGMKGKISDREDAKDGTQYPTGLPAQM